MSVAQWFDQGPVFTILEENDLVVDTDRHYTQGVKLTYLHADNRLPAWLAKFSDRIGAVGFAVQVNKLGTQIGQSIYTPGDLSAPGLLTADRPYAGWLYTGLILQRRGLTPGNQLALENFQLDLGIIGPESLADRAQTWVHEIRGFETPRGWEHQLRTEPGIALKYQRTWLFSPGQPVQRWFDLIPHAGMSLGNVETSLRVGGAIRLGWNLPDDFGVQSINALATPEGGWSPTRRHGRWGFYGFAGAEGSAVFYTAFLDGNLFHESHHVRREPLVGELKAGGVLVCYRAEMGVVLVHRTRDFIGQSEENRHGSVFLKLKF